MIWRTLVFLAHLGCLAAAGKLQNFEGTKLYVYEFAGQPMAMEELDVLKQVLATNEGVQAEIVTPVIHRGRIGKLYFELHDQRDVDFLEKTISLMDRKEAEPLTRVVHLQYTDAEEVGDFLQKMFGLYTETVHGANTASRVTYDTNLKIVPNSPANTIVLDGPKGEVDKAMGVIRELDTRTPQVLIEVLISEITLNDDDTLGIEWSATGRGAGGDSVLNEAVLNFGNMGVTEQSVVRSALEGFRFSVLNPNDFEVLLSGLRQRSRINVVSRPKLLTANNRQATFSATQRNPVLKTTTVENVVNSTVDYLDIGVSLKVTPRINRDNYVDLSINPVIQEIIGFDRQALNSPIYSERTVDTTVLVKDNHTLIIGGLISESEVELKRRVPILGDIPIVREAFQRTTTDHTKTELMIFLTPHILEDHREAGRTTQIEREEVTQSRPIDEHFAKGESYREAAAERAVVLGSVVKTLPDQDRVWLDIPNPDTVSYGDVLVVARHLEDFVREETQQWIARDFQPMARITIMGQVADSVWQGELQDPEQIDFVRKGDIVRRPQNNMIEADVKTSVENFDVKLFVNREDSQLQVTGQLATEIRNVGEEPLKEFMISDGGFTPQWRFFEAKDPGRKRLIARIEDRKKLEEGKINYTMRIILSNPLMPGDSRTVIYEGPFPDLWMQEIREDNALILRSNNPIEAMYEVWFGHGVEPEKVDYEPVARLKMQGSDVWRWYKPREKFNFRFRVDLASEQKNPH